MQVSGCRSDDLLETMCRGGVTDDPRRAIYDKHNAAGGKRLVPSGHIVSRIKHQGKNQVQNKEVEKKREKPPIQQNEEEELPAWVEKFIDDYLKNH